MLVSTAVLLGTALSDNVDPMIHYNISLVDSQIRGSKSYNKTTHHCCSAILIYDWGNEVDNGQRPLPSQKDYFKLHDD